MIKKEFSQTITVKESHTADKLGSGLLPVYSTPALVALMEGTSMQLIETSDDKSSVGISISVKHLKASAIGETITCRAQLQEVDGRKYKFYIEAHDSKGDLIGEGIHERMLIDVERFLSKIK